MWTRRETMCSKMLIPAVALGILMVLPAQGQQCPTPAMLSSQSASPLPAFFLGPEGAPEHASAGPCTATADCGGGVILSCQGSGQTTNTCSGQDRNCSLGLQGFVECNGSYTYCGSACCSPACTPGQTRWVQSGCCCDFAIPRTRQREQRCNSNGCWENTGAEACSGQCSPNFCEP